VASTRNGPVLSRLLVQRLDSDRVLVMAETAGSAADLPGGDRDLSAIARAGLSGHLGPGEIPVPGSALTAVVPGGALPTVGALPAVVPGGALPVASALTTGGRRSVLIELVDRFAATRRLTRPAAAIAFTHEYARLLLPPLLTLATRHGIGLEAHLQNCVPTFVDGVPHRLALRDF